ncbi:MAG: glycosyltransferase family protein [Candidatus Vogelbacteria bacterium]|nr:glycosyltransferase family protein [Candidatus Vogelbacteria bacterium]
MKRVARKNNSRYPKTVAFVQVRTGSSRFPSKVLYKIGKREIFLIQLDRMKRSRRLDQIVVVTTAKKEDDVIVSLCRKNKIPYFRGSEHDLLDRYYKAANKFKAELVAKIPSDEPLIDGEVIDEVVGKMQNNLDKYDFVSNIHPPSFPDGLDVEIMPFKILEIAWKKAKKPHEREHATPYIWDNPKRFRIGSVTNRYGSMFMTHRWTMDYPEDFEFFKAVFSHFKDKKGFLMKDVLDLLQKHPEIGAINARHVGINWFRTVPGELKTVSPEFYRQDTESSP